MTRPTIPSKLREEIAIEADYRCGYCRTPEELTASRFHIEHIIPLSAGGTSERDNLWLACPLCNGFKAVQTHAIDPDTGQRVTLFNPRTQLWSEHFDWGDNKCLIVGLTPTGRATVHALRLNNEHMLRARRRWAAVGWHPPNS